MRPDPAALFVAEEENSLSLRVHVPYYLLLYTYYYILYIRRLA